MLAYFDCFSGISGDMTLGALIDLGVPADWLEEKLSGMPLEGFHLEVNKVHRNGIGASLVQVVCEGDPVERSYADIRSLIYGSNLPDMVKTDSLRIFQRLAEAEAGIHGCEVEAVHFHEVGATDAIVDIVGAVLGLDYLEVAEIIASRLPLGTGFVDCRHGRIPVPAPASLALLKDVPVFGTDIEAELVTPTGAAIITSMAEGFGAQPAMRMLQCGYGAGQRELKPGPNLLRVILGHRNAETDDLADGLEQDQVSVLETAIDDMSPEMTGYCVEQLFEDGALDVALYPIFMKKNRPATLLQVICRPVLKEKLIHRLLTETTTLGVRHHQTDRCILARKETTVNTSFGEIAVKRVRLPDGGFRIAPEYEACRRIALENQLPLQTVYATIAREVMEDGDT